MVRRALLLLVPLLAAVSALGQTRPLETEEADTGTAGRLVLEAGAALARAEPNSLKGLGPNTIRMSAQMLLSRRFGRLAIHANAGLAIQDRPLQIHEQSDFLAYGLALVPELDRRTWLVAEIAGLGVGPGAP